jgi:DNA-binding transcriptional regulator YiaG
MTTTGKTREGFQSLVLKWRTKRKLSQAAAAAELGVPYRTFQDWEYGRRAPQGLARTLIARSMLRDLDQRRARR